MSTYSGSEELFSDADGSMYSPSSSRCSSPEIPIQNQTASNHLSTYRSHDQGTSYNQGGSLPNPREHTTIDVRESSGKSKPTKRKPRSSQPILQGRLRRKELQPSKLIDHDIPPDDSSSDSDDEDDRLFIRESKRRRQHSAGDE